MAMLNLFMCFLFWGNVTQPQTIQTKYVNTTNFDKNISDTIILDSLIIENEKIDSVLSQITKGLKEKSLISVFYVTLLITNKENIKIVIRGDTYTDYLFSSEKYGEIYGYLQLNEKYIFIIEYPTIEKIGEIGLFKKTDKIKSIKKHVIPADFHQIKLENPEWLYLYKQGKLILEKSTNTEYFYGK